MGLVCWINLDLKVFRLLQFDGGLFIIPARLNCAEGTTQGLRAEDSFRVVEHSRLDDLQINESLSGHLQ